MLTGIIVRTRVYTYSIRFEAGVWFCFVYANFPDRYKLIDTYTDVNLKDPFRITSTSEVEY
jgi:hypothetical protein